jgi:flagellar hook assembly protein FlgD
LERSAGTGVSLDCWGTPNEGAQLVVFNAHNKKMKAIGLPPATEGWQKISWDGTDEQGNAVPAGTYYLLPSQDKEQTIVEIQVKN